MNKYILIFALGSVITLSGCRKEAGSGGTSAIVGHVEAHSSNSNNTNEAEVTQIIIPNGEDIADGDYILLNTPTGGTLYYLWFKWNNGVQPDPNLAGRTGIQVTFDFTETNTQVAANTMSAINAVAGSDFITVVNNDILTLTNTTTGFVADADELSSNLLVDIQNQGQSAGVQVIPSNEIPAADERVYLIYGDEEYYSESVRTDANGNYRFSDLNRGDYTIFAFSTSLSDGSTVQIESAVTVSEKKSIVSAPDLNIIK
ncbi:carboxypeptidase-like regulatory domain-containing protein [Crocinitomicaceae bacterium]|nr:carboxypeptidase-like regulatory domain-containing protein [Crocinitomicaceae bacterium]